MKQYNIILADDHTLFRSGILNILRKIPSINEIHEASNGKEVISRIKLHNGNIDLAILDLKMPKMNGLEVCRVLNTDYPNIKKIILSMIDQEQFISQMLQEGINAYLLKTCSENELIISITEVLNKGFYFDDKIISLMQKSLMGNQKGNTYLTQRELEVLEILCKGDSTTEIAEKLYISKRTVETHKQKLMDKTGTKSTIELVIHAMKNGLVDLNPLLS